MIIIIYNVEVVSLTVVSFPFNTAPFAASSFSKETNRSAIASKSLFVIAPSLSKSIRVK